MNPDNPDPFHLARFVAAQEGVYPQAIAELRRGRKMSHWVWYVLPQLRGLGTSHLAQEFGITGLPEARAYLAHPILGARLIECVETINSHRDFTAAEILGDLDAMKFRSCATLFAAASYAGSVFETAISKYFNTIPDPKTMELLAASGHKPRVT